MSEAGAVPQKLKMAAMIIVANNGRSLKNITPIGPAGKGP
jgi:hypothetical protein